MFNRFALTLTIALMGVMTVSAEEKKYATFVDQNEKAFSFLMPEGWKGKGGIVRLSGLQTCRHVEVNSPDGEILLASTDLFPTYVELTPMMASLGFRNGSPYSPGGGSRWEVQPYMPGAEFYTRLVLPKRVPRFKVTRQVNRPDLSTKDAYMATHAQEIEYRFERNGKDYVGAVLCITRVSTIPNAGRMWGVVGVLGYEAPEKRVEEAKSAIALGMMTCRYNPIWLEAEAKGSADRAKIVADTGRSISNTISSAYWSRSKTMDSIFKRGSDARRGTVDLYDAETGKIRYGETNKYNYYWTNARGDVVGTNTYTVPGVGYRPMAMLP